MPKVESLEDKFSREEKERLKEEEKSQRDKENKEKMFSRVQIGVMEAFKKISIAMGIVSFGFIMLYLLRDRLEFFVGAVIAGLIICIIMYLYSLSLRDIIMEEVRREFGGKKK